MCYNVNNVRKIDKGNKDISQKIFPALLTIGIGGSKDASDIFATGSIALYGFQETSKMVANIDQPEVRDRVQAIIDDAYNKDLSEERVSSR